MTKPTIARIWRGRTRRDIADEYADYLQKTGIPPLVEHALGVMQLREDSESETTFLTISFWESVEAMSRFTGTDPHQVHHLPRDAEYLVELPERIQVLTISHWSGDVLDARY